MIFIDCVPLQIEDFVPCGIIIFTGICSFFFHYGNTHVCKCVMELAYDDKHVYDVTSFDFEWRSTGKGYVHLEAILAHL